MSWKSVLRVLVSLSIAFQPGLDREGFWHYLCYDIFGGPRVLNAFLVPLTTFVLMVILIGGCYLCYWLEIPYLERNRAYPPGVPWPWKDPNPVVRANYSQIEWGAFKRVCLTFGTLLPASVVFQLCVGPNLSTVLPEEIPSRIVVAFQLYAVMVLNGLFFYLEHRLFHIKWLYRFHKIHHEFKSPTILSAYNFHWIELIPTTLGVLFLYWLLGMHLYAQVIHLITAQLSLAISEHSGYDIEFWLLPFDDGVDSATHDVHHRTSVNHNFGSNLNLWDHLCGTYMAPHTSSHRKIS